MTLFEEIVQELNEELGISQLVSDTTNILISDISKDAKKQPYSDVKNGCLKNYTLFGKKYNVFYTLYFFETMKDKEKTQNNNPGRSTKKNDIYVSVCYIKEINKYIDYDGTTQHELEHVYQIVKSKKYLLTPQSVPIYQTAVNLITNGISKQNFYETLVGFTVYYNNKFEKDAFANDIYRTIIDNPQKEPMETVKKTDTYSNIVLIEKYMESDSIFTRQIIENIVFKNFNKHYKWWYNIAKKVVNNYKTKIGKILAKAHKDLYSENSLVNINKKILEENPFKLEDFLKNP